MLVQCTPTSAEHGRPEFVVWSHANIAGVNLEEFLEDTQNVQETELIELLKVFVMLLTPSSTKRCYILRLQRSARITKAT